MHTKFSFFKGAGTVLALFLFLTLTAQAQTVVKVFGYCERGGQRVMSGGSQSQTTVQKTYPGCTVRVMDTGTATLTAIYTNTGLTVKSNPFVADTTTGYWEFYVVKAARLDIQLSGGISPNAIAGSFYWATDYSAAGASLPTIYNQGYTQEQYNAPATAVTARLTTQIGDGVKVVDDPTTSATRLTTSRVPTGVVNIVTEYGANPDPTTTTGTITAGSTSLVLANTLNHKVGSYIAIPGLGISGATFYARITAINQATKTLTLSASPAGNGTNVTVYPDNYQPIQDGLNFLYGDIYAPAGFYLIWNEVGRELRIRPLGEGNPTVLRGAGQGSTWFRAMGVGDLFRTTKRQELTNLQVENLNFDTHSSVRNTTKGWAFNLGEASVVNFPQFKNIQITGFRGGIFCNNCQGGGVWDSVLRYNFNVGFAAISDQTTWASGNENNVLSLKNNQIDFQSDPATSSNRVLSGLAMSYEADNAVTDASYRVTSTTPQFNSDDVGRIIRIESVGTTGGDLMGLVLSYDSSTQITITTRGARTALTAFTGASGIMYRIPLASIYLMRANWFNLENNILQGNFGSAVTEVNSVLIERSNGGNIVGHYSEQGGGSLGAHIKFQDSTDITISGFKTNSQGSCNPATSHCFDIWAVNSKIKVSGASGSLSILHNRCENCLLYTDNSTYGAPDFSNESGPQKIIYGPLVSNYQWGNVQVDTNTLYDATYGEQLISNPRFRDV